MYKYAMFPTAIDDLAYCNSQGTCDVMCDVLKVLKIIVTAVLTKIAQLFSIHAC